MSETENDRCPVCLGYYRNPRILPCTHSFCEQPCIQNLLESAEGTTFTCPCCQQEFPVPQDGVETFPCNTNYMQQVNSIQKDENQESQAECQNHTISNQSRFESNVQRNRLQHDSSDRRNRRRHDSDDQRNRHQHDSGDRKNRRQHDLGNQKNRRQHNPRGHDSDDRRNRHQHDSADRRNRCQHHSADRENEVQHYSIDQENGRQRDSRNGFQHDIGDRENEYQQNLDDRGDRRKHLSQILSPSSLLERQSQEICAICLENYQNPRILPCMHNFCRVPCLQDLIERAEGTTFSCPLCRQEIPITLNGVSEFPFNTNFRRVAPGQERRASKLDRQNVTDSDRNSLAQAGEPASQMSPLGLSSERCPICLEDVRNPRALPCRHKLCETCLQNLHQRASRDIFRCPLCRLILHVSTTGITPFNNRSSLVPETEEHLSHGILANLFSERTNLQHSPSRQSRERQRLPARQRHHILSIQSSTLTPERLTVFQMLYSYVCRCCTSSICKVIFYIIAIGIILGQIGYATSLFVSGDRNVLGGYILGRCILDVIMILAMWRAKQKAFKVSFYIHITWSLFELVLFLWIGCTFFTCYYDLVVFGCFLAYRRCFICTEDRD